MNTNEIMPLWCGIAAVMLGDNVPDDLKKRLENINALVKKVKPLGDLHSTQVIATVIDQWKVEQRNRLEGGDSWLI